MLKHSLNILAALIFSTSIISCGDSEKKKENNTTGTASHSTDGGVSSGGSRLDGAWVIKRAAGIADSLNIGTVYTFNGNKLSFGKEGFVNPGTTEITDSTFSFQAEGNDYKFMYDYHFEGDTLVVEMQKSNGQVFHMVKE